MRRLGKIFFLDTEFLPLLRNFRILWLAGRFGGGKTALATILAAYLVWAGDADDIVANFSCDLANPRPIPPLRRTVFVLDEAWQFARDSAAVGRYAAFLRKTGNFILLPSVFPVHPRLATLWCERIFSAYVVGIPLWVWRWNLTRLSYHDRGYFAVGNPHLVFQHFDSWDISQDDGAISDLLSESFRILSPSPASSKKEKGTRPPPQQLPLPESPPLPAPAPAPGADAAAEISDAVASLEAIFQRFDESLHKLRRRI